MSGLSVKSFHNKSNPYIPSHLRKKKHSDIECKIADFDISDAEERGLIWWDSGYHVAGSRSWRNGFTRWKRK